MMKAAIVGRERRARARELLTACLAKLDEAEPEDVERNWGARWRSMQTTKSKTGRSVRVVVEWTSALGELRTSETMSVAEGRAAVAHLFDSARIVARVRRAVG